MELTLQRAQEAVRLAVQNGATVSAAAKRNGYTRSAVMHWYATVPGYRERVYEAKRIARATDPRKQQVRDLLAAGLSGDAAARRVGVSRGQIRWWAKTDAAFQADYRRRVAVTGRASTTTRFPRLLALLRGGAKSSAALAALGLSSSSPTYWRKHRPEAYRQYREALEAGRARVGRRHGRGAGGV